MNRFLLVVVAIYVYVLHTQATRDTMMTPSELLTHPNLYVLELDTAIPADNDQLFCLMGSDREWGVLMESNAFLGINLPYRKGLDEGVYTCKYYSDIIGLGPWERRQRTFL